MHGFNFGPFSFSRAQSFSDAEQWEMRYGGDFVALATIYDHISRASVIEAFAEHRAKFIRDTKPEIQQPERDTAYECVLVKSTETTGEHGETIGIFYAHAEIPGMSPGLIDDRFETWAVTEYGNMPMSADEFERLAAAHAEIGRAKKQLREHLQAAQRPHPNAWISELLPDDVLTENPDDWRSPSAWEIRHIVGEGSFTGISGATAAGLVGVTPQNFRKYTATDAAKFRQSISYAMWHLLLSKLGVKENNKCA